MEQTKQPACRDYDPELWHPMPKDDRVEELAKTICQTRCDMRAECLDLSYEYGYPDGVWGGFNQAERQNMPRRTLELTVVR